MSRLTYLFEGVELDAARREIRIGERRVDVPPQVFDTLEFLARHANRVVTKGELGNALWEGRVVTDASVSQAIRKARAALADCGVDASIIRTRHGHGYQLDADVSTATVENGEPAAATAESLDSTSAPWQSRPFRTGAIIAVLGGVLVTVANITEILTWLFPRDSVELLQETQSTIQSTDAKVDELMRMLRDQAAISGSSLDPASESTIRDAVRAIVVSVDARKQNALDMLVAGEIDTAAAAIAAVARDLGDASSQSVAAAADSWREAGAIYYTSNVDQAVRSYEAAYELRPRDPDIPLELAYSYIRAGRLDDAAGMFGNVLALEPPPGLAADAHRGLGVVHKFKGEYEAASEELGLALDLAGQINDIRRRGLVLLQIGAVARAQGDNDTARQQFETAVGFAEEIADRHLLAESLNNLGIIMAVTDDFDAAARVLDRCYDLYAERHDLAGQATALGNLGANALRRGDVDAAETYLTESVALGERLGWQRSIAMDLINLGGIAAARREFDEATSHLQRALDIATSTGLDEITPIILANLGEVARDRGDDDEACRYWGEAQPRLEAMGHGAAAIVADYRQELGCP